MSASGKFLDYDGLIHFFNSKIKPNYTTLSTNQTISGIKTIKNQLKVQYGGSGGIVLGADSSNTTLTNNTIKLGSIVSPVFSNINKTFTVLQSRGEGDVNVVSVGGTAAGTNPTVFQVTLDNSIGGSKTRDVLLARYNDISIGTNTINLLDTSEGNVTFSRGGSSLAFVGHELIFTGAGLIYSNEEATLAIGSAGSTTVLPSLYSEDKVPVWRLGNSEHRFEGIYVDELHSHAEGHDTSIRAIFSALGPGYKTDHITASTLLLDGHSNDGHPIISFGDVILEPISYDDSYFGNAELRVIGDLSAVNAKVDSIMESNSINTGFINTSEIYWRLWKENGELDNDGSLLTYAYRKDDDRIGFAIENGDLYVDGDTHSNGAIESSSDITTHGYLYITDPDNHEDRAGVYLYRDDDENNYFNIEDGLYVDGIAQFGSEVTFHDTIKANKVYVNGIEIYKGYNNDGVNLVIDSSLFVDSDIYLTGDVNIGGTNVKETLDTKADKSELTDLKQEVVCDHVGEITGNTNDEHGLAIKDQQMLLTKIEGQTLIANNICKISLEVANGTQFYGLTVTYKDQYSVNFNGTPTEMCWMPLSEPNIKLYKNHKYLLSFGEPKATTEKSGYIQMQYSTGWKYYFDTGSGVIFTADETISSARVTSRFYKDENVNLTLKPQLIDLTLMFGYGNEPTLDEWKAMNMPLIPYSTGYILNSKANLISTTKNICPRGQWLANTRINSNNGSILPQAQNFNLLNVKIPVVYGVKYYFWSDLQYSSWLAYWFDNNDKYLGLSDVGATSFVTPLPNSAYMIINTYTTTSLYDPNTTPTEYNLTPSVRITEPLPYQSSELVIDQELGSLEYIDNLTNTKHSKVKSIDLGTVSWYYAPDNFVFYTVTSELPNIKKPASSLEHCSIYCLRYATASAQLITNKDTKFDKTIGLGANDVFYLNDYEFTDPAQLKAALSGVMLYYESNEEVVTPLETPIADGMTVWNGGQQIQQGQLPYKLTKQYSLSLGSQVLANIQIDKEQQAQINDINKKLEDIGNIEIPDNIVTEEYLDNVANGLYENISYEISQEVKDVEKMTTQYIGHPEGGDAWLISNIGAICIRLPALPSGGHIKFKVSITAGRYQASADYVISATLTSYLANTTAYCTTSIQNGDVSKGSTISLHNLPVRFSYKTNGYYYIYIGDVDKEWTSMAVSVSDVTFKSYAVAGDNILRKDWAITLETSFNQSLVSSITNTALYTPKHEYTLDEIKVPNSVSGSVPYASGAYISSIRAMRLFGLPADQIIVEYSDDGGQTWTDAGQSDISKMSLFNQSRTYPIYIPQKNGKKSCDCMTRITITGMKYNVPSGTIETEKYNYWNTSYVQPSGERYCTLDFGYFWVNANADRLYIEHQMATGANPNDWVTDGLLNQAKGWAGGNYIKFGERTFGATVSSQSSNYWNHRFIFRTQATDGSFDDSKLDQRYITDKQYLYEISCYGANCWVTPNEMMKSDRAYYVSTNGTVNFENTVVSKAGFYFQSQSDVNKKLLRADGWWQHIDTLARSYTKYTLNDSTKLIESFLADDAYLITLNEEYGYYYIDLSLLQYPSMSSSEPVRVFIKSNYPNTKCVLYTNRLNQSHNVENLIIFAQNGFVFPTTNPIEHSGYITTLVNDPQSLDENYVEFENTEMKYTCYLIEWTEHGDCKVMWTTDM